MLCESTKTLWIWLYHAMNTIMIEATACNFKRVIDIDTHCHSKWACNFEACVHRNNYSCSPCSNIVLMHGIDTLGQALNFIKSGIPLVTQRHTWCCYLVHCQRLEKCITVTKAWQHWLWVTSQPSYSWRAESCHNVIVCLYVQPEMAATDDPQVLP